MKSEEVAFFFFFCGMVGLALLKLVTYFMSM